MFYRSVRKRKHFVGVLSKVNIQCIGNNFVHRKMGFALLASCNRAMVYMTQSLVSHFSQLLVGYRQHEKSHLSFLSCTLAAAVWKNRYFTKDYTGIKIRKQICAACIGEQLLTLISGLYKRQAIFGIVFSFLGSVVVNRESFSSSSKTGGCGCEGICVLVPLLPGKRLKLLQKVPPHCLLACPCPS